jgi:carboxymethylenebutenolidase
MKTERVTLTTADGTFGAYVARPDVAPGTQVPAVVVLQEIFGINSAMRQITEGLASQGYLAICPDLFWRIEPGIDISDKEMEKAFGYFGQFDVAKGVADIQVAIDFIRTEAQSTGKVGSVGFCLGGLLAFLTAVRTNVDASVGYYGVGIEKNLDGAAGSDTPLMLHIAEEDGFVDKAAQAQIIAALEPMANVEIYSYPGCDHAFARPGGAHFSGPDAQAAGLRSLAFFKKHLG